MVSLNKIIVIGNVGGEPEMRFTPSGHPVTSFSVATNWVTNTSEGESKKETEWFKVTAWDKLAERCNQMLGKGKLVYVEGRLKSRTWEQDGQKRFGMDIVADKVLFLDRAPSTAGDVASSDVSGEIAPEDLPF